MPARWFKHYQRKHVLPLAKGVPPRYSNGLESLENAVSTSQGHQEDVSGDSQLATAAKAACFTIVGETLGTEEPTYREESENNRELKRGLA